ncbi:hypothetical protein GT204_26970 [Streptomyces sp. SID4919]|uniref:AraC-like ligand-binding domain-containing protein n=1 Tax=Streptomyces sp. AmelKG-E11A TaxID=1100822 RepID=UPI000823905E|nr:hypothetical protein [Streptomyces sp. AmelKG-E11A]MYY12450.1 hypothetical protein [Streptomyces sp. SID4919]SCK63295.1 AraC-binding-like domain-containing protein [Streptomyces sp. AmelKG-E11A]
MCALGAPGGSARFTRADRTSTVGRGDRLLFDSSHPYEFTGTGDRPFSTTTLHVPRGVFPLPARRLDGLLGRRLPGDRGLGAVLGGFLRDAGAESGACGSADLERLGSAALDLSAAFLAHRLIRRRSGVPPGVDVLLTAPRGENIFQA